MLPSIRAARGRIVFITSIGGLMAIQMFGAYHAAKFGLEAVGDVFRQELAPWGIQVSIIEPGSIATPIWERGVGEADAPPRARHRGGEGALSQVHRQVPEGWHAAPRRGGSLPRRSRRRSRTR